MKPSGLQRRVISLYYTTLKEIVHSKRPRTLKVQLYQYLNYEFNSHKNIPRTDFDYIEYLLRTGKTKIEDLLQPHVKSVYLTEDMTKFFDDKSHGKFIRFIK
jgi:hypothetical protein